MKQTAIPAFFMRGGTSRGPFFRAEDLPPDRNLRDAVLLAVMGSPDSRQIDGMGGGHPLTSKVGIVKNSVAPGIDLEFTFCQVGVDKAVVDTTPNCGNMLSAVVPFALEAGLKCASSDTTKMRVLTCNTGMTADITVQTPEGILSYDGEARIAGVPGTSSPIWIDFLEVSGSVCDGLLPTGAKRDSINLEGVGQLDVTCIDNGMPMVLINAHDLGIGGNERVDDLNNNDDLKVKLESLRALAAERMGLGDVSRKPFPKMCLLASPEDGGSIMTRCFIPHVCHSAIGVLAAVTVATACVMPGSLAYELASTSAQRIQTLAIEHPTGTFEVEMETSTDAKGDTEVRRARILRTARALMSGEIMIPSRIWTGHKR